MYFLTIKEGITYEAYQETGEEFRIELLLNT